MVAGFGFVGVAEVVDVAGDSEAAPVDVEVFGFAWSDSGHSERFGQ